MFFVCRGSVRNCLIVALGIFVLLIGCRQSVEENRLTFAVGGAPSELDYWEVLLDQFRQESGVEVGIIRQPTDTDLRRQNLVVALQAGKSDPDVFLMDVAWLAQFAASGWLEPLGPYLKPPCPTREDFFSRILRLADSQDGNLIALPVYVDGGLLYYRKDLLKQFGLPGPPETWEELLQDSLLVQKKMRPTRPDFYGFVWQGAQYEGLICNFMEFAGSEGGFVLKNGRPDLNNPTNVGPSSSCTTSSTATKSLRRTPSPKCTRRR